MFVTCPTDTVGSWNAADFLSDFRRKAIEQGIPLAGSLELTRRCNLSCVHCYLPHQDRRNDAALELSTTELKELICASAEAGCLSLTLTGGEPLLRKDFAEVYQVAKEQGMLVVVFTNATLLTQKEVALFKDLPPRGVEVSVYGATRETYERVTGVDGSYVACRRGLDLLAESGATFCLKTIAMTLNRHELDALEALAVAYGVSFHFDSSIFPRLDGDMVPLAYRMSPEVAAKEDFCRPARAAQWVEASEKNPPDTESDRLFQCGAGRTGFHVTAAGRLQPCVVAGWVGRDLRSSTFAEAWKAVREEIRSLHMDRGSPCRTCGNKNLCGYCPAFFRLETGSETRYTPHLCSLGRQRERLIKEKVCQRQQHGTVKVTTEVARAV